MVSNHPLDSQTYFLGLVPTTFVFFLKTLQEEAVHLSVGELMMAVHLLN